jgi:sulfotransferase family protein
MAATLHPTKPAPRSGLFIRSHRDLPPPVIILGMHRSGTSLLSQMLRTCGLFIGSEFDKHFESLYFRRLNKGFMDRAGAAWYEPDLYLERRAEPKFHRACRVWAEHSCATSFAPEFIGWRHRVPFPGHAVHHWGWKDPRTCLTLPVWEEIFPEAKRIHVTRHPLDVAISLQRREEERQKRGKPPFPLVGDLDHNLRLWETHVAECLKQRSRGDLYYELQYETLLRSPQEELAKLVEFCGLDTPSDSLSAAAALSDGSRTRRFEDEQYRPWLEKLSGLPSARELGYA